VVDDQTVSNVSTGKSPAGIIVDVDDLGVWVETDPSAIIATVGLLAANNLSDVGTAATAATNLGLGVLDSVEHADLTLSDDLDVAGDGNVDGALTARQKLVAGGAAYTVGSADDGDAIITTATDTAVITLPDAAAGNAGKRITVVNTAADGAALISVSPHASDAIRGGIMAARASGTVDKDLQNTKATALKGDYVILFSDGSGSWYIIGGMGVWVSQS
jgi:hypothetical protein